MSSDRYITLAQRSEDVFREKASKFIGIGFPVRNEEEYKKILATIVRDHHRARHFCYAWVLGATGERHRAVDAGEPSGTAGQPIRRQLRARSLTDAAVVVVRYFGGTLLGKAGLVRAYSEAAHLALEAGRMEERVLFDRFVVECTHAQFEALKTLLAALDGNVIETHYEALCTLVVEVPKGSRTHFLAHCERHGLAVQDQFPK